MYIYLAERWRGRVKGLCGNFDGSNENEYETSGGGVSLVGEFVNSWRKESNCPVVDLDAVSLEPCTVSYKYKIIQTGKQSKNKKKHFIQSECFVLFSACFVLF